MDNYSAGQSFGSGTAGLAGASSEPAFAELYERCRPKVKRFALRIAKLNEAADEIVQNVLLRHASRTRSSSLPAPISEYDYILQGSLKDAGEYEEFLEKKLCALPMVDKVNSSLVLKESKMEPALVLQFP